MAQTKSSHTKMESSKSNSTRAFVSLEAGVPSASHAASPSEGRSATNNYKRNALEHCASFTHETANKMGHNCWRCHFAGPCGNVTDRQPVSCLTVLLGCCGFGGSALVLVVASCMEGLCGRASSAQCPDDVDCDSDVIFPCNVTTTHPDCFVLQREAAQEGMCTCYDACSTPPYSEVLPVDFTVKIEHGESRVYCGVDPNSRVVALWSLVASCLLVALLVAPVVGCCEPKWGNRLARATWLLPLLLVAVFVFATVETAKATSACASGYQDQVVGHAFPSDMDCNNAAPALTLMGCFIGLVCACYLPVLLHMRKLAAGRIGSQSVPRRLQQREPTPAATLLGQ